jgi:hypothetical protein
MIDPSQTNGAHDALVAAIDNALWALRYCFAWKSIE